MKKTHKKILFIILAVLIICGGIVVYWKFNNPSPSQCGFHAKNGPLVTIEKIDI